jgi:hypothetical protein
LNPELIPATFLSSGVTIMAGSWKALASQPPFPADTMLLLTDGSVFCHEYQSKNWHRLTPDPAGEYDTAAARWTAAAPLPDNPLIPAAKGGPTNAPLYFASAVLRDGTVFVAGGEYNSGIPDADMLAAQVYDPFHDSWKTISPPAGWTAIGDAPCCVRADGQVLLGSIKDNATALFDPVAGAFHTGPTKNDSSSEESFALLPDGTVLAVQCTNIPNAEKLLPGNGWVSAGATPVTLPQACPGLVAEIGASVLLANGKVFAIASGNTALYTAPADAAQPGTWAPGPVLRDTGGAIMYPMDAPAVLLPNGKVLLVGSPAPPCDYPPPSTFFEYDPDSNTVAQIASPPVAPPPDGRPTGDSCFVLRFLLLPSGEVLLSDNLNFIAVYAPDGAPRQSWQPTITRCPTNLTPGATYTLEGRQLNGLSQAVYYGDDATMATNYPLVRLRNRATGKVWYCPTAGHSTMGVATGTALHTTTFTVPAVDAGAADLFVVANGIPSAPLAVSV